MTEFEEQAKRLQKPARGTALRERRARKAARDGEERKEKEKVRKRDPICRFPLCPCKRLRLRLEVSHKFHKGMGGNPAGDRSSASTMVRLCIGRHQESNVSIDKGTLDWRPLDPVLGADGPIAWFVLGGSVYVPGVDMSISGWVFVARELSVGRLEPLTLSQRSILLTLGRLLEAGR